MYKQILFVAFKKALYFCTVNLRNFILEVTPNNRN